MKPLTTREIAQVQRAADNAVQHLQTHDEFVEWVANELDRFPEHQRPAVRDLLLEGSEEAF